MAAVTPPFVINGQTHDGRILRGMLQALIGTDAVATGAGGVDSPTALAVTANGTPNWSVNVAAGGVFIPGAQAATQGTYFGVNDAIVNLSVTAADPVNTRKDLVIAYVADATYSGAANTWALAVVTGTPAVSPLDPSLVAYPNSVLLARLTIPGAAVNVASGYITDLRFRASALNAPHYGLSTARPSSPNDGDLFFDTDKKRMVAWSQTDSAWNRLEPWSSAGRTGLFVTRVANQSIATVTSAAIAWDTANSQTDTFVTVTSSTVTVPSGCGGLYLITAIALTSDTTTTSALTVNAGSGLVVGTDNFANDGSTYRATVTIIAPLAAGNTIATNVRNASGGSVNYTAQLVAYRLSV